jgi:putative transposase
MSDLIWLSEAQMRRIEPHFPLSHGVLRVDDRQIINGIIFGSQLFLPVFGV